LEFSPLVEISLGMVWWRRSGRWVDVCGIRDLLGVFYFVGEF
jgi:hypothetical protein